MKPGASFPASILVLAFFVHGCGTHRVVQLGPGVDDQNIVTPFYAVTKNNVVIPEYVVDRFGNYPTTEEDAWRRFKANKDKVEPLVQQKYVMSKGPRQIPRYILGFGFMLVAPIAIPVSWLGEQFSPAGHKKRSFGKVANDYVNISFNPPEYERPRIRESIDTYY